MKLKASTVKLGVFLTASALFAGYIAVITGDVRFADTHNYHAVFADVSGLKSGDQVRVAGVEVGKVSSIGIAANGDVNVGFNADTSVHLTTTTTAVVRYKNLVGDRFLELDQPAHEGAGLAPGSTIPVKQTQAGLDLDKLLSGFKPLFVGLTPTQINSVSGELVNVLQGQGSSIYTLLATLASFTSTISAHDAVIGDVIDNLNTVLGTVAQHDDSLSGVIVQLDDLVKGLVGEAPDITDAVTHIDSFATSAAALLANARSSVTPDLSALNAVSTTLNKNTDTLQQLLSTYPGDYTHILPTGSFGDFFNFYICGIRLKLADDNGTPIYAPPITSDVARCK